MTRRAKTLRGLTMATLVGLVPLGLVGCAGDGIEFNGKIFEAVGLAGDGFGQKSEPRTQARAPLVLPPNSNRLPEPGSLPAPQVAEHQQQWPRDRDALRGADDDARKVAQQKHCQDGNWREKAYKDEVGATAGPNGSCTGSIFSFMSKSLFGGGE